MFKPCLLFVSFFVVLSTVEKRNATKEEKTEPAQVDVVAKKQVLDKKSAPLKNMKVLQKTELHPVTSENQQEIIKTDLLQEEKPLLARVRKANAWISLVQSDGAVMGARVLGASLRKFNTNAKFVMIVTNDISSKNHHLLEGDGWQLHLYNPKDMLGDEVIDGKLSLSHLKDLSSSLAKAEVLNLTQFETVGFLDSNSMVTSNIDHLFECGEDHGLCMGPSLSEEIDAIATDVFVVTPENGFYNDIYNYFLSDLYDPSGTGLLEKYFYLYCKSSGYPVKAQTGEYKAPLLSFTCSEGKCRSHKAQSHSPCYRLGGKTASTYNFKGKNTAAVDAWTWHGSAEDFIKIVRFEKPPWEWRNSFTSGWVYEWNMVVKELNPPLFHDSLFWRYAQPPILYLLSGTLFLITFTITMEPYLSRIRYNVLALIFQKQRGIFVCVGITLYAILKPLLDIFWYQSVLPDIMPPWEGWLLSIVHCTSMTVLGVLGTCFMLFWMGRISERQRRRVRFMQHLERSLPPGKLMQRGIKWTLCYSCSLILCICLLYTLRWSARSEAILLVGAVAIILIIILIITVLRLYASAFFTGAPRMRQAYEKQMV